MDGHHPNHPDRSGWDHKPSGQSNRKIKGFGQGRRILITGAAKRLGAHLAEACLQDGWHVILHCHQSIKDAEALIDQWHRDYGADQVKATIIRADLSCPDDTESLMAKARESGPLHGLINSASSFLYDDGFDFTAAQAHHHLAVNLIAPALLIRDFVKQLPDGETGSVINMLDSKLFGLNPDYFSYTLSKAGMQTLGMMAAQAYAPHCRINAIAPGITLPSGGQNEAEFQAAHKRNLLGKGASVEEIISAMRLLLTSPAMTGHTIVLDGGAHLNPQMRDVAFLND